MPLIKSHSKEALHTNIKELVKSGRPLKQAVAASLSNQRKYKKMAEGGAVEAPDSLDPEDMDESTKDHSGLPVYPYEDAKETLSENVVKENQLLADALQGKEYGANENTHSYEADAFLKGHEMGAGERESMSGDEQPEPMNDGPEEPMSDEPMKADGLEHSQEQSVPEFKPSPLSEEAKKAIEMKKAKRRFGQYSPK